MTNTRNKPMRFASVLLVLTLITTSFFCGVLAKYVITDNAYDTARVAKFGVVTAVDGSLFGQSYTKGTTANDGVIQAWAVNRESVAVNSTDQAAGVNVVAPGTHNDKGMTISVTGTPEVTTRVIFDAPEGTTAGEDGNNDKDYVNSDIFLKNGDYSIMARITSAEASITTDNEQNYFKYDSGAFTQLTDADVSSLPTYVYKEIKITGANGLGAMTTGHAASAAANWNTSDYYPIQWKIDGNAISTAANNNVAGVLTQIGTGLNMSAGSGDYAGKYVSSDIVPNTNLGTAIGSKKITWAWDFSTAAGDAWKDVTPDAAAPNWENTTLEDGCDTLLGEMIAQATTAPAAGGAGTIAEYKVAKMTSATAGTEVLYAQIDAASGSANKVYVAYTGESTPATWDAANVACLTVGFGARVTVEQVD